MTRPHQAKKGDAKAVAEHHRCADTVQGFDEQVGVHGEYATADASPPRSSIHPRLGLYVGDVVRQRVVVDGAIIDRDLALIEPGSRVLHPVLVVAVGIDRKSTRLNSSQ